MSAAPEKPDEPERGIRCRQCGCGHFYTVRTRKLYGGRIMRERVCRYCGKKLVTHEKAFG